MSPTPPRDRFRRFLNRLFVFALGAGLITAGLFFAPSDAYALRRPFQELGEQATGVVVSKHTAKKEFEGGGQNGGTYTFEEKAVVVDVGGRVVTIDDLVLAEDFEALSEGDEVAVTFIRGEEAREALPKGPFYLLTSSVEASPWSFVGWAFNGRPAHWKAVATGIPGVIVMLFWFALMIDFRRPRDPQ